MELYFTSGREERFLKKVESRREAVAEINKFCEDRSYKIHYMRTYKINNEEIFDVGSHTEGFILKDILDN